jgi:hypothetical protein
MSEIQSVDELADLVIAEYLGAKRSNPGASYDPGILQKAAKLIEADRAAHIALGRELERKESQAVIDAMEKALKMVIKYRGYEWSEMGSQEEREIMVKCCAALALRNRG